MNKITIAISLLVVAVVFVFSDTEYAKLFRAYVGERMQISTESPCPLVAECPTVVPPPQHTMYGKITKDREHVYYEGKALLLPPLLDMETFSLLPGGSYGADVHSIYDMSDVYRYGSSVLVERLRYADPQTFEVVYDGGVQDGVRVPAYAIDAQYVYIGTQIIPNADPKTFEFLTEHGTGCDRDQNNCPLKITTKDKNCIYLDGERVLDDAGACVDPRTCIHNSLCAVRSNTVLTGTVSL